MSNVLYAGFFAIFVALVVAVRLTTRTSRRRQIVNLLVLYVLAVHALLMATRRDGWPFVTHGAFIEDPDDLRPLSNLRFVAVDSSGEEHVIDPRSWSPIHDRTLVVWWLISFKRLTNDEQQTVMSFLLDKAESARRTDAVPAVLRFIRAPAWYSVELTPQPSARPYTAFRAYLVTRTPAQKRTDGSESASLIREFRR